MADKIIQVTAYEVFTCCECNKNFKLEELCSHAPDIIKRNIELSFDGFYAKDINVMCVNCCDNPKTWEIEE